MEAATHEQGYRLTRADLELWLATLLRSGRRVVAPIERDGLRLFRPAASAGEIALGPGKTAWSPKEELFPRTETLLRYETQAGDVRLDDPAPEAVDRVLFGLTPCDAAGLARLDAVLGPDPRYAARRAGTTIVSLACAAAGPECFCTAVGGAPHGEEGSDFVLVADGDGWLARPLTAKGEALATPAAASWSGAEPAAWERAREQGQRVAQGIRGGAVAGSWAEALEARFDSPAWGEVGRRCVGCSICTYVCPSCTCFDVHDEGGAECGSRCRSWDSCTFSLFTRHATGHNPRPTQAARYRQRVLHKFSYYPLGHDGRPMCVGCGRCVQLCPVGLDVLETVTAVMAAGREASDAGR